MSEEEFCPHETRERRPLRVEGYDRPVPVCPDCWDDALEQGLVVGR